MAKHIDLKDLSNKRLKLLPIRVGCYKKRCDCNNVCLRVIGKVKRQEYDNFILKIQSFEPHKQVSYIDGFLDNQVERAKEKNRDIEWWEFKTQPEMPDKIINTKTLIVYKVLEWNWIDNKLFVVECGTDNKRVIFLFRTFKDIWKPYEE